MVHLGLNLPSCEHLRPSFDQQQQIILFLLVSFRRPSCLLAHLPSIEMSENLIKDPSLPVANPTKSYWQSPPHPELLGVKSLSLPEYRDIVVLGSGITSCSAVLQLFNSTCNHSVTVLEAREVCSGATGRNGGRINCVAVLDYAKYRRLFGPEAARKIVGFEMDHFEAIYSAAKDFGPQLVKRSEIRPVKTVAAIFSDKKLSDMKVMLKEFEKAFPDLTGRWWICEGDDLATVRSLIISFPR